MGASLTYSDVSFTYAASGAPVLRDASLWIPAGAFCLVVGPTGSGKSTLLSLLDPATGAAGERTGTVLVDGTDVRDLDPREAALRISHLPQNARDLLVSQTVESQIAFKLESLGMDRAAMRVRVAEVAGFLGVAALARKKCDRLSQGQASLVALATAVAPFPDLLVCDEPTASLDPEATRAVVSALARLNRELGLTVVVATHEPQAYVASASHCFTCESGSLAPAPVLAFATPAPFDVPRSTGPSSSAPSLELSDVWLRYGRRESFVLENFDAAFSAGAVHALVGAHGCGKTTLVETLAGMHRPFKGKVRNPLSNNQVYLPQDASLLFKRETVREELSVLAAPARVDRTLAALDAASLVDAHIDELSGGQRALVAFAKCVLSDADLFLLDEPTAALDHAHATLVARQIDALRARGATVVLVAHDMQLVRALANDVSLVFAGRLAATLPAERFFEATRLFV